MPVWSSSTPSFEFAATLHAVSALAELRAEAAIEPLLTIYDKAKAKTKLAKASRKANRRKK
jgi:hypothetical protein